MFSDTTAMKNAHTQTFHIFFKLLITKITNSCLFAPLSVAELINQKCHEIAIVPLTQPNLRNIWGRFLLFLSKPEHLLRKSIHLLLFQFNEHLSLYHKITQWTLTSVTQSTKLKQLIGDVKTPWIMAVNTDRPTKTIKCLLSLQVAVCCICFFVILPLNLVGTILGRNLSGQPNFPCRVNAVPRPIPEKKW